MKRIDSLKLKFVHILTIYDFLNNIEIQPNVRENYAFIVCFMSRRILSNKHNDNQMC